MKKKLTFIVTLPLVVLTLLLSKWVRSYYLISTLFILEAMLPFFISFEAKKTSARELVLIAVMAALAAVSRTVFAFIPHFKPITAIVMITGIAFGAQAGFLSGAMSAFASNFAFGQGLWTPWQMFAYAMGGFLAGIVFHGHTARQKLYFLAPFGFLCVVLLIGPLLDCSSLFLFSSKLTPSYITGVFIAGFPANLLHSVSTALTMVMFAKPLLLKLERLQTKYGLLE